MFSWCLRRSTKVLSAACLTQKTRQPFARVMQTKRQPVQTPIINVQTCLGAQKYQHSQDTPNSDASPRAAKIVLLSLPETPEARSLTLEAKRWWDIVHQNHHQTVNQDVATGRDPFIMGLSYQIKNKYCLQAVQNGMILHPDLDLAKKLSRLDKTADDRLMGTLLPTWISWKNFYVGTGAFLSTLTLIWYINLEKVPISGRWQLNFYAKEEGAWGAEMQKEEIKNLIPFLLRPDHPDYIRVKQVLQSLIPCVGLEQLDWEVYLVNAPDVINASVSVGGKVIVYSGILPFCHDENDLATVLSHEIAHVLAGHDAEKWSKNTVIGIASIPAWPPILFALLFEVVGPVTISFMAYAAALVAAAMWSSRKRESEADYIGLVIAARAGYDIHKAVGFWERMKNHSEEVLAEKSVRGEKVVQQSELFSTHPHDEKRIEDIQKAIPKILEKAATWP